MSRVLTNIYKWASGLEYWEQALFQRITNSDEITESVRNEILQLCLEDKNLRGKKAARPKIIYPSQKSLSRNSSKPKHLTKISNIKNVNKLVPDQCITFCPELTAIYGANGSGKSGYARILGKAGFCRGSFDLLADVTKPGCSTATLSADFEICYTDETKEVCVKLDKPCEDLSGFYMFDASSVSVHLTGKNQFSFSPAGLEFLQILSEETDEIRDMIRDKIETYTQPHSFDDLFEGQSRVTEIIDALGADTDTDEIKKLATLPDDIDKRTTRLDKKISTLRTQNIPKKIKKTSQTITDLEDLSDNLEELQASLGDVIFTKFESEIDTLVEIKKTVEKLGVDQFKSKHFQQIGSDAWQDFIISASELAIQEEIDREPYPQKGDICLLCHQPLSSSALVYFKKLWKFIEGEAQKTHDKANKVLARRNRSIKEIDTNIFGKKSVSYRYFNDADQELRTGISDCVAACNSRKKMALDSIQDLEYEEPDPLPSACLDEINATIESLNDSLDELNNKDPKEEIKQLVKKASRFRHRRVLAKHKFKILKYIKIQKWSSNAEKRIGNTRHITTKYKKLFKKLVEDGYIDTFHDTLSILERNLNVDVRTVTRKGRTYRQISINIGSAESVGGTPDKVLSEGEKRAVAIADFLTEVNLDNACCGIILDDPVTSLDLDWREIIAEMLVKETDSKQVIIFTHDLPFLYHLNKHAGSSSVAMLNHWIKRGDGDDRPGYVYTDNSPALEKQYKTPHYAERFYKQAKDSPDPILQEPFIQLGFGALRTSYEALIIFELFNDVIQRFEERISPGRLMGIVWDYNFAKEINEKYGEISRYIEGHSHSDQYAASKPTLKNLRDEIDTFSDFKKQLKQIKKQEGVS